MTFLRICEKIYRDQLFRKRTDHSGRIISEIFYIDYVVLSYTVIAS